jgi:DMSO/TMAO reductase YedYZ molybdopterin-dependent catalytic subunit
MLEVSGLVGRPRTFRFEDLAALPEQIADVGAVVPGRSGGGVRLEAVLATVRPDPGAGYLTLESTEGGFSASIPLAPVASRGIVVYREGDHPLPPAKGGPVRFVIQDVEACGVADLDQCANVKFLGRIVLAAAPGRDTRPTTQRQHEALHQH